MTAQRSRRVAGDVSPLPERACIVKGGLCGFCRLGEALFRLCLQTISAAR